MPRPSCHERGYTSRWVKVSAMFRRRNPLCAMCAELGLITPSAVTDHIVPHRGDQRLFWDRNNWQALCMRCHSKHKQRLELGQKVVATGDDGWPSVEFGVGGGVTGSARSSGPRPAGQAQNSKSPIDGVKSPRGPTFLVV